MKKPCSKCKIPKEHNAANFLRSKRNPTGFKSECKECSTKREKQKKADRKEFEKMFLV